MKSMKKMVRARTWAEARTVRAHTQRQPLSKLEKRTN
jgi:hypothetical protein